MINRMMTDPWRFYRILDEVFGALIGGHHENWVERANKWFIEFQRFAGRRGDNGTDFWTGGVVDVIFGFAVMIMDTWIDGLNTGSSSASMMTNTHPTLLPDDSACALDDEPTFSEDFVDEWI